MREIEQQIHEAVQYIQNLYPYQPSIGIILGSGLGAFAEWVTDSTVLPYRDIPHFPISTVAGHAGKLILAKCEYRPLAIMAGRFHHYEGYSLEKVTFPIRVLAKLGIKTLIVTNAAGGISADFKPGDLMFIKDHINLMGSNPLIGKNDESEWGPRFPDMTNTYTPTLRSLGMKSASELEIPCHEGVYLATTGPSYETPAEIRMMRTLGADAVGMSTVPEVIVARQMGLQILGISCITNMAAGMLKQPIDHREVQQTGDRVKPKFIALLRNIIVAI